MFWIKRLKPAHFSSLSVRTEKGEGEKSCNEMPQEQGSGWVIRGTGTQLLAFSLPQKCSKSHPGPLPFPSHLVPM